MPHTDPAKRPARPAPRPRRPVPASSPQYRPRSYFDCEHDDQTRLLTTVQGTLRRATIRQSLESGGLGGVPPAFLEPALPPGHREWIGSLHPHFMGGEYLPAKATDEVEIARVSLQSTTGDVTAVYAIPDGERISLRVVDEYDGDTLSVREPYLSRQPLSMDRLVQLLLLAWNLPQLLREILGADLGAADAFFTAESEFYPYLDEYLHAVVTECLPEGGA